MSVISVPFPTAATIILVLGLLISRLESCFQELEKRTIFPFHLASRIIKKTNKTKKQTLKTFLLKLSKKKPLTNVSQFWKNTNLEDSILFMNG